MKPPASLALLQLPADYNETLAVPQEDKGMQADLARLNKSCCVPQKVSALDGAPIPTILEVLASSSC